MNRKAIRQKVVDLLLNKTECGGQVFKNRARPLINMSGWASELPALIVYARSETCDRMDEAPVRYERKLTIVVEVHCGEGVEEDVDDRLDGICEDVEHFVSSYDWHLDEVMFDITGTQIGFSDKESEELIAAAAISFEMTYYTDLPGPRKSDSLDIFQTAENTYRVGDADSHQTVTPLWPTESS